MVRISWPTKKSIPEPVMDAGSMIHKTSVDASVLGMDAKNFARQMKDINRIIIANGERPTDMEYRVVNMSSFWYMYEQMEFYRREVSILSTIIGRTSQEALRYGIGFEPRFAKKCESCGHETQLMLDECPICHSFRMRAPDPMQKEYFKRPNGKSFIEEANDNQQSLVDVVRSYMESELLNNQAYMLCVAGDFLNEEDKSLVRAYPLEFLSMDARKVRYLYDESGKPGTRYAYLRSNRKILIDLEDPDTADMYDIDQYSTEDGDLLYPAFWKIGMNPGATGEYWVYGEEEVYQDHWMRPALTYGIPIWFDIDDDLLTYHFIEKHNLKKYKFGYVRKMLVLPGFNDEDIEDIQKGITDILATNDNSIPIVCTPPQIPGTAEMKAQVLELGTESSSDLMMIKDDIRTRICAHMGVPDLFAGDVEASGGMNNESQQITVFDRYLMGMYNNIDRLLKWMQGWFPEITDWDLVVYRPTKAYTDMKRRMDKAQEAQMMKQLGFDVFFVDGEFRYSSEPIDQIERRQQEQMQQMMMGAGQGEGAFDGGMLPGDGEGPPEKGTARREDPEIGDSEDEIDLAKRESQEAFAV